MSGHAPSNQLIDYYSHINCERIILNHGSESAKKTLSKNLEKELEKHCNTAKVVIANNSMRFSL